VFLKNNRTYALTENTKYVNAESHSHRRGLALLNPYT
jgi:hypothetical protein